MAKGTVNKVIILGRLGQDPDLRATRSGTSVATLNVATNELGPKDQNGQRQEQTEWHRCVIWGKTAEIAAHYLGKGSLVYLEGKLRTRKWQDQNGIDRYSTEVVCHEMQMVGGNGQTQGNPWNGPASQTDQQPAQSSAAPRAGDFDDFDDDIPFN